MSNRPPSTTSRRTVLASLAAALPAAALATPIAAAAATSAATHPDADLIQAADRVVALHERVETTGVAYEERADLLDEVDTLLAAAIALPATTREGLAAKARMLRAEYPATGAIAEDYDPAERLVQSLLSDLIRQGGRA